MSTVLAIDPGTTESGWVLFAESRVLDSGVMGNASLLAKLSAHWQNSHGPDWQATLAIEMIQSFGMPVGQEVFDTVKWIGRFQQAWYEPDAVRFVYRKDVKLHLCGSSRAKDPNVRQALLDLLGPQGTKANKGPLYGVKSHAWSALAVAVVAQQHGIAA